MNEAIDTHACQTAVNASRHPALSVVVPAYNSARTIERCLMALRTQQTALQFEVIVVDSGLDDTALQAQRVLPQARIIQRTERTTPGEARNIGAAAARGDVLGFVDSDTCPAPDWVETAYHAIASGSDVVCGSVANANPHSAVSRAEELLMFNEFLTDSPRGPRWFAVSANMAVRRDVFERAGGFPDWRGAEDVAFSRRVVGAGGSIEFLPELRVLHDNRTDLRPFLRNQLMIGRYTARARREVPFADTGSFALFLLLLPLAPLAKLSKIIIRLALGNPRRLLGLMREFPIFAMGLFAYCGGLVLGTLRPRDARP
ncbi:MAG: glycosyltransferase [Candidatus Binatia bacterium]|jgi:cellulose synthase/poly-beta-1,6-N-acetylglucosamine synthase-like glycosyltransferase